MVKSDKRKGSTVIVFKRFRRTSIHMNGHNIGNVGEIGIGLAPNKIYGISDNLDDNG